MRHRCHALPFSPAKVERSTQEEKMPASAFCMTRLRACVQHSRPAVMRCLGPSGASHGSCKSFSGMPQGHNHQRPSQVNLLQLPTRHPFLGATLPASHLCTLHCTQGQSGLIAPAAHPGIHSALELYRIVPALCVVSLRPEVPAPVVAGRAAHQPIATVAVLPLAARSASRALAPCWPTDRKRRHVSQQSWNSACISRPLA